MIKNVFFEGLKNKIFIESEKGEYSLYDLFDLSISELINLYKKLRKNVVTEEDELLNDLEDQVDFKENLKFEIVREILKYKKNLVKQQELKAKKKQLEKMLREIRIKKLQENPELIEKEIEEISKNLEEV